MAATPAQQIALSESSEFRARVRASLLKKSIAIVEDVLAHEFENYTAEQNTRALSICGGQSLENYYNLIVFAVNVAASTVSFDFDNRVVISSVSDADLDAQAYTLVFVDLV